MRKKLREESLQPGQSIYDMNHSDGIRAKPLRALPASGSSPNEVVWMKTVRDIMTPIQVWVDPRHSVQTAIILLKGHGVPGLPVLEGEQVVGMLEQADLLNADPQQPVSSLMHTDFLVLSPETALKQAAHWMAQHRVTVLPVMAEGQLVGLMNAFDLLPEIGRSYDPMTSLPWSDMLREWSIEMLQEGREITIIFFDMDQFGAFNKRYGHVVGDEVLRMVAEVLRGETDPEVDLACRYGGDEFAVATLRRSEEAGLLAHQISRRIGALRVQGVEMPITVAYGYHGGKRTREREQVHYAATVDNLINLASRECQKMKGTGIPEDQLALPLQAPSPEPAPVTERRVRLQSLSFVREPKRARAQAYLSFENRLLHGVAEGEKNELELIAQAVLSALTRLLPEGYEARLLQVIQSPLETEQAVINVVLRWQTPSEKKEIVGAALATEDLHRVTAAAVLDALNRPLATLLTSGRCET